MKVQKVTFIAYIFLGLVVVWFVYDVMNPNFEKRFKQNSIEFAENRVHFEEIIRSIKLRYLDNNQNLNLTELSKSISKEYEKQLDEIGIKDIEISFDDQLNCSEKITYTFNVKTGYNIRKLKTVQVIYSPCDKQTVKGFYMNSGLIDINGEGNNWLIFSDTDFM
jgi:hypothetical protein